MSMKEEKLKEAAKLNQLKYVFSEEVNKATISELKTIGIGNFVDGANWMMEQLSQPVTKISEQEPLSAIGLRAAVVRNLRWGGVRTIGDLINLSEKDIGKIKYIGWVTRNEIIYHLHINGLKLKGE